MRFIARFFNSESSTAGQVLTSNGSGKASWQSPSGAGGSSRVVAAVSTTMTLASAPSTDYVYLASGTITLTLPTAVASSGDYTIKNVGTGVVTVNTTSSQTIDGGLTAVIGRQYDSIDLVSDNANWNIV